MRRKKTMMTLVAIVFALVAFGQWQQWKQKDYQEIAALKNYGTQYALFQKIIANNTAGFQQLWAAQGNNPDVVVTVDVMSYLIITNRKTFNMYEVAFRHAASGIVAFLLDEQADRAAFFYGLEKLPTDQHPHWLALLGQHGGLGSLAGNAEQLSFVISSAADSPDILDYLKQSGADFDPHWTDTAWKKERSLMKDLASNCQWHPMNVLWPYLSSAQQHCACAEIADAMKRFAASPKKDGADAKKHDDFEQLNQTLRQSGCVR